MVRALVNRLGLVMDEQVLAEELAEAAERERLGLIYEMAEEI